MGENQGMVWIIIGVIVVGAIIMALGNTMKTKVDSANTEVGKAEVPTISTVVNI